ncbi:MAG: hypothetical protein HYV40_03380 [Candidatus Levybacteria bacterium]|nr:hypothetical protein [Candidatus Levybacteria bacterium]
MASTDEALLKALHYSDMFDFPLTKDELYWFAVEKKIPSHRVFEQSLSKLRRMIGEKNGMYYLKGREGIVDFRHRRSAISAQKKKLGQMLGRYIARIPTVTFVGISGGVSSDNADEEDDIDFFVISQPGTLWTTRVAVLATLSVLGRRRVKNAQDVSDMACVNMLLDGHALALPQVMRSLYTAWEVVSLQPLFSRGDTYLSFLQANQWIFSFLPQAREKIATYAYDKKEHSKTRLSSLFANKAMVQLSKFAQLFYMGRQRNESMITPSLLAFYPRTFHGDLLKKYHEKLRTFGITER